MRTDGERVLPERLAVCSVSGKKARQDRMLRSPSGQTLLVAGKSTTITRWAVGTGPRRFVALVRDSEPRQLLGRMYVERMTSDGWLREERAS